jgi:hypothetical protein
LLCSQSWLRARLSAPSMRMRPPVGSKKRQARFTIVDLPAPVSPTMATVVPAGMSR